MAAGVLAGIGAGAAACVAAGVLAGVAAGVGSCVVEGHGVELKEEPQKYSTLACVDSIHMAVSACSRLTWSTDAATQLGDAHRGGGREGSKRDRDGRRDAHAADVAGRLGRQGGHHWHRVLGAAVERVGDGAGNRRGRRGDDRRGAAVRRARA